MPVSEVHADLYNGGLAPRHFTRLFARNVHTLHYREAAVDPPALFLNCSSVVQPVRSGISIDTFQVCDSENNDIVQMNTEAAATTSPYRHPQLQIKFGDAKDASYGKMIKEDDIVVVPLFGAEENKTIYYDLMEGVQEIVHFQQGSMEDVINAAPSMIPWGRLPGDTPHLLLGRVCGYFGICRESCKCELLLNPQPGEELCSQGVPEGCFSINVLFGTSRVLQYELSQPDVSSKMCLEHLNNFAVCQGFNVSKDWWCAYNHARGSVPGDEYNLTLCLRVVGRMK